MKLKTVIALSVLILTLTACQKVETPIETTSTETTTKSSSVSELETETTENKENETQQPSDTKINISEAMADLNAKEAEYRKDGLTGLTLANKVDDYAKETYRKGYLDILDEYRQLTDESAEIDNNHKPNQDTTTIPDGAMTEPDITKPTENSTSQPNKPIDTSESKPSDKPTPGLTVDQLDNYEAGVARIPDWVTGKHRELMLTVSPQKLNKIDWSKGTSLGIDFSYKADEGYDKDHMPPGDYPWTYKEIEIQGFIIGGWDIFDPGDRSVNPGDILPGHWVWLTDHDTWVDWTRPYMISSGCVLYADLADGIPGF